MTVKRKELLMKRHKKKQCRCYAVKPAKVFANTSD
jgi:hypothetical protein